MRIAREEIFGPVVSVIPCRSLDEAIDIGNSVEYGLSASIYTQDINRAFTAMRDLYTGIFYVNAPTIGAEVHLPFGGTKNTGNGHREAGIAALDVFSRVEVDLHRLQRQTPARPDRCRADLSRKSQRISGPSVSEGWRALGVPASAKATARSRRSAVTGKRAKAEGPSAK